MKRSALIGIVGAIVLVVGAVLLMVGGSTDGGVPRIVSLGLALAGVVSLAVAGVISRRTRRHGSEDTDAPPPQDRSERRRAFSVRLVVCGLALVPLSLVIAGVAGNDTAVFSWLGPAMVATIVAFVVVSTGRLFIPALVISILLFLLFLVAQGELGHPESFADFVPAVWRLVGAAVAAAGAAIAMRQRRRRTLRRATQGERMTFRLGAIALIAVSIGSFVLDTASRTTIARADGAIVVDSLEDTFDPDTIRSLQGRVRFLVRNDDSYAHTFSIDALELDQYIAPRSDRIVSVTFPRKGMYEFYCAINGHEGMDGVIDVG